MSLLSWNCQGIGGSLDSPKMRHLARLISSTNAQVIFISETRNTRITKTELVNKFNLDNAYIISAEGLSGGLWLLSRDQVDVNVVESCNFYFLAICYHKHVRKKFGPVCVYGDPHHRCTVWLWKQICHFVMVNQKLPSPSFHAVVDKGSSLTGHQSPNSHTLQFMILGRSS